jgi:hypothetical protein
LIDRTRTSLPIAAHRRPLAYLARRSSRSGLTLELAHSLAKYMRRGEGLNQYFFLRGWQEEYQFEPLKMNPSTSRERPVMTYWRALRAAAAHGSAAE